MFQKVIDRFKLNDFWDENSQMYVDNLYNDIEGSLVSCSDLHVATYENFICCLFAVFYAVLYSRFYTNILYYYYYQLLFKEI